MIFTRIAVNPQQMGGVPCIRGLRIPVATVVGMVADGMKEAEILKAYPDLVEADIYGMQNAVDETIFVRAAQEDGSPSGAKTGTSE